MSELPKAYDPKLVEEKWISFWEQNGCFKPDSSGNKPPFCIVIPPPNVTGVLHMGHALVGTIQDILIRWKRMSGFETLWVPGTDHAGIATQTVVERDLYAKTGKRRKDFSREEFLSHVWNWKEMSEGKILGQLKKLGSSCDWDRLRFTMDEGCNKAVRTCFKKMYDDKLIYRGDYLVNWDPVAQTALSDDEVEHEEKDSFLWHIRYPVVGGGEVIIATTRPETMLGDTAVAVHPKDERYSHLIGKQIKLPLTDRLIPIVGDHFVDPSFGSGVVKITPAHDFNDFEVAGRHNLPYINIMTPDGHILDGAYAGQTMAEARESVLKDLGDFLVKKEPHKLRVGISYRSKAVIEPYLSKQWFVNMGHFKEKLISAVKEKRVKLIPPHWEQTYFHWIENLRDWCISRQLWWGHRIPIWYKDDQIICYDGEGDPPQIDETWTQDPDVLDTWFSSALWPFSTLGWPDKTEDLKKFYPTSTLITGHDILFFWVARMIMMGEYIMQDVPFKETFLHGLIYGKSYWRNSSHGVSYVSPDEKKKYDLGEPIPKDVESKWEKMSKSKGNIIDPLEIIDSYGTDAMRFALCSSVTHARQIDLDRRRFEEYKNFANKIWNGSRFVFMNLEGFTAQDLSSGLDLNLFTLEDKWILSLLNQTTKEIGRNLTEYTFDRAATRAYEFFWNDFCATYVELAKPVLFGKIGTPELKANKQRLLVILLCNAIRLMHPISPFITEEIFSLLKGNFPDLQESKCDPYTQETIQALLAKACIIAPYPEPMGQRDEESEKTFDQMNELVHQVRNIRAEMQLPPSEKTELIILAEPKHQQVVKEHQNILTALTPTSKVTFTTEESTSFGAVAVVGELKLMIPIPESLKLKEKSRLEKEREKLEKLLESTQAKLANDEFRARAPKQVVQKLEEAYLQTQKQLSEIADKLKNF
ncbi:MAG: valine--tRNA ligase [Chlamydiae bacterium CG10_big_fil_rev_8_21_14_0_10_42_34]|nr:MAG: valine--tRNA ligase [Chlamydiae bacterium CG10_big_fil_rev_8_21_14_0_10_42_34]